ncbi:DUF2809 domain-containing protein [Shewanella sp. C32]|uniref:DUF2809 domain-containing protein n=1 Tax=Shewanella electrica TaxID=515560 RepID=A0ABT2FQG2_9GAMM|nr:DUF2809 domain-containing protein [Shewanella electrica]MCH1926962.1 DUF2809 domain-containing protein [Shewanella electrica]MCS4558583.1 DUF2809 domain-containing protein [Shewanella electrica]
MLRFHRYYFAASVALLLLLVFIALYVHDRFIRPFMGDVLVVVWLHYSAAAFIKLRPLWLALATWLFACAIEVGQYFNLVSVLGLEQYRVARIVIGSTFDWLDLLAYSCGLLSILLLDAFTRRVKGVRRDQHVNS